MNEDIIVDFYFVFTIRRWGGVMLEYVIKQIKLYV